MPDMKTCTQCGRAFARAYRRNLAKWEAQTHCSRSCADAARTRPAAERFEAFVVPEPTSGCHLWIGAADERGYGTFNRGDRTVLAHRFVCEQILGPLPADREVRHLCHTPACVNPEHLRPGTHRENMHDAIRAGRNAVGSRAGGAKLTETAVAIGRRLGTRPVDFARQHGIGPATARAALRGENWRHVPVAPTRATRIRAEAA
ncbi:HNH endonuclease signature motif containing protein [Methylobacterium oxalidis]|uniref:HNH endonuclease signature motif containing protein n=1 Tax=Methylobacterium oxalidis TaxID=944322 RepID=UPI003315AFD1